jgi:acyl-CoA reductase-like NAD-dependent aldehyde dehydrogenase
VFADADFERAAEGVLLGFTYNAGHCCIATTRLILERAGGERFKALLLDRIERARSAGALRQPVATEAQYLRVLDLLAAGGGRTLCGGRPAPDSDGFQIPPTVLEDLPADSPVAKAEIFGPVLSVHLFDHEDEAVGLANDTVYGLAAAVWSGDVDRALRVADRIRAGRLWVNSPQVNFPELPVGGFGCSGIGREAGSTGIRGYCEAKTYIMRS